MTFSIQTGKVDNFTASTDTDWYSIKFKTPYEANVVPLVFAQIQTCHGQDTPGLRLQNITNTGFEVRMNELIMHKATSSTLGDLGTLKGPGTHPKAETLAWMAVSQ